MVSTALATSIVLAALALTSAYGLDAVWIPAGAILFLATLWLAGQSIKGTAYRGWMSWVVVGLFIVVAVAGAWLDLSPLLLTIGLTATVSAWDLDYFARQLNGVDRVVESRKLTRRHLQRLLIVDGVGLLIAVLALNVQIRLSFAPALGLGLIALLGLIRVIDFMRRKSSVIGGDE